MTRQPINLSQSHAARRLGVTVKALRLYEQRRPIGPGRNAAGWRVFAPAEVAREAEVVSLRRLGLNLAQIARGEPHRTARAGGR